MILRSLMLSLFALSGNALAVQPVNPPGLLPTAVARPLLTQEPGVAAARAGLEVARQEAGILEGSPYEWTARAIGQRRNLQSGPGYNEWNVGIERTIRLPGKATADRRLGEATVELSQARYGDALHAAARALLGLWLDWLAAEHARELAGINLQSTQSSLAAVEERVRAGDASRLDLSIARAELAEQERMENDAKTQSAANWARLSTRFPGISRENPPLPWPLRIGESAAIWREHILAQSDEMRMVRAQLLVSQGRTARAQADRTPDPTLGVFTASDIGGRERVSGLTISIPIPGGLRESNSARALASVEVSRQEVERTKRQLEADIESAVATARGAYDSLQIAKAGATAMQENAALMQRAYVLGEAELQAVLLTRRQATSAAVTALQAQVAALKAYYGLLVDAHLVWDLGHE